jgi:hypothetical protein
MGLDSISATMSPHAAEDLPAAPASVEDANGLPRFGTYAGSLAEVNLARLRGVFALSKPMRLVKHKRWQYALVATPEILAVLSIADLSYTANAFACAVDLRKRTVLFDAGYMGLPSPFTLVANHPAEGARARFAAPGARIFFERPRGQNQYRIGVNLKRSGGARFSCSAALTASPAPALTVIAPVPGGGIVNVTQKWAALPASGVIEAGGRRYSLDGGMAGLDYTNGYLARRTTWRWALASGRLADGAPLGLNAVEGFNEATDESNENALWLADRLIPLGRARFEFNRENVLDEWRITTEDGRVSLRFTPVHAHREEREYKIVKSHFVQPLGLFDGEIRIDGKVHRVESLPGVVEDQDILW